MRRSLKFLFLAVAASASLSADTFSIVVNITSSYDPTTIPTGVYQGSFTTNGTCSLCTVANGGITSFQVPIMTGTSVTSPSVLLFDALDASNLIATVPQYDTTAQSLSSTGKPTISMLEQIISGTAPNVAYPFLILNEMTPTTLNTAPTTCDLSDTVRRGCVSIRTFEMDFATGTYTIQPAANPAPSCTASTSNVSNFNGTAINPGSFIWFNSNLQFYGAGNKKAQIAFKNQSIQFTANQAYNVPVPDAVITIDPSATCASTIFDAGMQTWRTTVPLSGSDEIFVSGLAFPVPAGFSKVSGAVTWQGTMSTDTPTLTMNWKWGAAVYSNFTSDYSTVAPKAAHTNTCAINNSDHAGTPEGSVNGLSLKKYVVGGARGGGGSNFTGSWSGTVNVVPVCPK
jgi:hypothetical protein